MITASPLDLAIQSYQTAIEQLNEAKCPVTGAIVLNSDNGDAHFGLGWLYKDLQKLDEAG